MTTGWSPRAGHTFVEVMVALGLTGVVLAALVVTRLTPGWSARDPLSSASADLVPVEQQLKKMVVEIQEATRVFWPAAGKGANDGCGIVNSTGDTVLFYAEPSGQEGASSTVLRLNLNAHQRGEPNARTLLLENVQHFKASVAPTALGKEPSLVDLDLAVKVGARSGSGTRTVNYVTSVFPRNVEIIIPDDVTPAGTPMVDPGTGP